MARYNGPEPYEFADKSAADVLDYVVQELRRVGNAMAPGIDTDSIVLVERHEAPTRIFDGLIVRADGTNWNPGGGAGIYARVAGAWVKL